MFPEQREVGIHLPRRSSLATESLWGAQAIADFMGVSDDYVRKLANDKTIDPRCPIRLCGGRYYVTRTEIIAWLMPRATDPLTA